MHIISVGIEETFDKIRNSQKKKKNWEWKGTSPQD